MIITRSQLETSLAEDSLADFIKQAWHVLEPSTGYSDNWHIHAICEHLEAVNRHQIQNLIINISPRCMKSLTVAVFWPVWTWIAQPLSLIHISEPTRPFTLSRMPSSA